MSPYALYDYTQGQRLLNEYYRRQLIHREALGLL